MNPYRVLGIGETAAQEEIRAAYLSLVKQYHPDKYHDDALKVQAGEKLKQINQAYELLAKKGSTAVQPENGGTSPSAGRTASQGPKVGYSGPYQAAFARARTFLNQSNLSAARAVLDAIPTHNAEWNYLSGVVHLRQGAFESAWDCISRAYALEPDHSEYRNAYLSLKNTRNPYSRSSAPQKHRRFSDRFASFFSRRR